MKKAGGRPLTSKQIQKLDVDWDLIEVVCKESEKINKQMEKSLHGHKFSKIQVRKSLNLMKKHHNQVKLSFKQQSTVLRKLSPRAANYVQRHLKFFDDELEKMTYFLNKWPWHYFESLWHFEMLFERFASSYRDFGLEVKMYKDLVKNTARFMA